MRNQGKSVGQAIALQNAIMNAKDGERITVMAHGRVVEVVVNHPKPIESKITQKQIDDWHERPLKYAIFDAKYNHENKDA